jgi:hypothetical protein
MVTGNGKRTGEDARLAVLVVVLLLEWRSLA